MWIFVIIHAQNPVMSVITQEIMATGRLYMYRLFLQKRQVARPVMPVRTYRRTESGGVADEPIKHYKLGLIRLGLVMGPFLYLGYWLGGQFAELIERYEIYVPDEEDDD